MLVLCILVRKSFAFPYFWLGYIRTLNNKLGAHPDIPQVLYQFYVLSLVYFLPQYTGPPLRMAGPVRCPSNVDYYTLWFELLGYTLNCIINSASCLLSTLLSHCVVSAPEFLLNICWIVDQYFKISEVYLIIIVMSGMKRRL